MKYRLSLNYCARMLDARGCYALGDTINYIYVTRDPLKTSVDTWIPLEE